MGVVAFPSKPGPQLPEPIVLPSEPPLVDDLFSRLFREMLDATDRPARSRWLKFREVEVYIRIGPRALEGQYLRCVQIANIITPDEYQRKGRFTAMVRQLRIATSLPFMLENTRSDFADALIRRGWREIRRDISNVDLVKYE